MCTAQLERAAERFKQALALDPQDRYPDCEVFAGELRTLLSQLSASFSEIERQRLAKEREGAWLPSGSWDFAAAPDLGPFALPSFAILGDVVGQVMHPELGGLLLGGNGLQIYPFNAPLAEDLRVRFSVEVIRGAEFWIFVRGLPPGQAYQFRIGSYDGKWMAIARGQGGDTERGQKGFAVSFHVFWASRTRSIEERTHPCPRRFNEALTIGREPGPISPISV